MNLPGRPEGKCARYARELGVSKRQLGVMGGSAGVAGMSPEARAFLVGLAKQAKTTASPEVKEAA